MRNYLHRLIERATGDRGAAPQRALRPQVGPQRAASDEDPLEASTIREATRPAADRTARSEFPLAPLAPRSDVRDPFAAPAIVPAMPAPRLEPATPASSSPRAERAATPASPVPRTDDRDRLAPPAPRTDDRATHSETLLAPTARRADDRDPPAAPTSLAPTPPAPAPRLEPPTPPAPVRLTPPLAPTAPPPTAPRLEPPTPSAPAVPAPPHPPSTLQPHAAPERPPLPPPPPILSIGRVVVEVMPAAPAPAAPAPIIVRRAAPAAAPAQSTILHRGFGLGQS